MAGTMNYDKDGVGALGCMYELAVYLHSQKKQLREQLTEIYET